MAIKQNKFQGESPTIIVAKDMDEAWDLANKEILWAPKEKLGYYSSLDTMLMDVMVLADTCEFNMNLGRDLWVTPSRWSTLVRQYVDPIRLFDFLEGVQQISTDNRGIVAMDMQQVQRTVVASNARANRRKWGGCMRFITYRAFPVPTITLFSRTSYWGYIGGLDMLLAHKIAQMACDMLTADGLTPKDMQFRWVLDTAQFHGFKSMAYIFESGQDKLMRIKEWPEDKLGPEVDYPTWKLVRNWWRRIAKQDAELKPYEEMKYGAEKRIRRRYHAQRGVDQTPFLSGEKAYGVLDTPIHLVSLDPATYSSPESRAIIKKTKRKKAEALVKDLFEGEENEEEFDPLPQSAVKSPTELFEEDD